MDENAIEDHLRGNIVVGIYPMLPDETCYFLVMDFDEADWLKDVSAVRDVCNEFEIPLAIERSRSGVGCHAWFFLKIRLLPFLHGNSALLCLPVPWTGGMK